VSRPRGSCQLPSLTTLPRRAPRVPRWESRAKRQPRPQERRHQAEPPPLCNESLELGNSGQVMPGDCKESRHVATPQRVVQDRVASVFVPAFELTFGLFDSTEARECLTRLERVLAGASPAASGNRVLAAGSDVRFYLLAPGLASAPGHADKNDRVEAHAH